MITTGFSLLNNTLFSGGRRILSLLQGLKSHLTQKEPTLCRNESTLLFDLHDKWLLKHTKFLQEKDYFTC